MGLDSARPPITASAGGDRAGALRAYDEFAKRIEREFGLRPSPETRALVDTIKHTGQDSPRRGA